MPQTGGTPTSRPRRLSVVRHGQSVGNVAAAAAAAAGAEALDLSTKDMTTPLSHLGAQQAAARGRWLAETEPDPPSAKIASPYLRAQQAAQLTLNNAGGCWSGLTIGIDERLRDRERGTLFCYLHQGLDERGVLELGRTNPVANASVTTSCEATAGGLQTYNESARVKAGLPVTVQQEERDSGA
jgi:broad specificity phosphatase PhoE